MEYIGEVNCAKTKDILIKDSNIGSKDLAKDMSTLVTLNHR